MSNAIYIAAVGARTPLGFQAAPAAAAVRAGITGLGQHPFMVDRVGDLMPAAVVPDLDPLIMGPERLIALAEAALIEACAPLNSARPPWLRLPVFLGLPTLRPGFTQQNAEAVQIGVARLRGLPAEISEVNVFPHGHAAGLSALSSAVRRIQDGALEMCLVGGVESYFHPDTMEWLDANRQLTGSVSRSGFVPGEGAGFCLLMTERLGRRLGLRPLARVLAVAVARETKLMKTSDICLGEGLTAAVRSAVGCLRPPAETIASVICDINGERYRSEEWGFVCLHLSQYFDDPTAYASPAECWGDMGAASGPLFAMLVCEAAARRYSKGPRSMVWASSEGGERGVAVLETADKD
jgi:3-oxoacyl-[acyl-carrier-protein] synthase-1